jgi:hypothetical protein
MSRRVQENLVAVIMLVIFVVMLYLTLGYSSRARLVPLPVCIFGIVLAIAQLIWQNLSAVGELRINILEVMSRGRGTATAGLPEPVQPQGADLNVARKPGVELLAIGIIAILLGMVFVIGPLPSVFIFTAGYLALTRHCSPARAILYAAVCASVLYGLFGFALGVQLNRGLLSGFFAGYVDF